MRFEIAEILIVLAIGRRDLGAGSVGGVDRLWDGMEWSIKSLSSTRRYEAADMQVAKWPLVPPPWVEWTERALA
jgi:hypothetical protein